MNPQPVQTVTGRLSDDDVTRVREWVAAATEIDGVAPLSEGSLSQLTSDHATHLISPAGYANITRGRDGEPAMIEAVIDPAQRGRGNGRKLVTEALRVAAAKSAQPPRIWAHGDTPGAVALAAGLGLSRQRELLQLRRPLTDEAPELPPVPERPDITVRTYGGAADDAELLRVNNEAFDWHPEQGGWEQAQIDERTGADWFNPAGLFLAVDAESPRRLLGFHWVKVHGPELGEVYIVGVDPSAQGRGLGSLLTLVGLHYLVDRGIPEVNLYVEGDNTAALATYEGLGFSRYAIDVAYG